MTVFLSHFHVSDGLASGCSLQSAQSRWRSRSMRLLLAESRPRHARGLSVDRIPVNCWPFGARFHYDVVLSLHAACGASRGSRTATCGICRSAEVWTGIKASAIGIVFSMLVMFFEVGQLLIYFLRAPQAGIPVIQTTGGPASWVSAADIAGLMALLLTMFVEVAILAFSLWLLYRTTIASAEFPHIGDNGR